MELIQQNEKKANAVIFIIYSIVYTAYLFLRLENELIHWVSLVAIPLIIILIISYFFTRQTSARGILQSVGIKRANLLRGMVVAILIGILFCVLQLYASQNKEKISELLKSTKSFTVLPITFLLVFLPPDLRKSFSFAGYFKPGYKICSGISLRRFWPLLCFLLCTICHIHISALIGHRIIVLARLFLFRFPRQYQWVLYVVACMHIQGTTCWLVWCCIQ